MVIRAFAPWEPVVFPSGDVYEYESTNHVFIKTNPEVRAT